jgi:hypothetical protein
MAGVHTESLPARLSPFHRPQWRITPERAICWVMHRFLRTRGEVAPSALQGDEFGLLLTDLDCYHGMLSRWRRGLGPAPPPPHEYLRPGREDWGCLAELVAELYPAAAEDPVLHCEDLLTGDRVGPEAAPG